MVLWVDGDAGVGLQGQVVCDVRLATRDGPAGGGSDRGEGVGEDVGVVVVTPEVQRTRRGRRPLGRPPARRPAPPRDTEGAGVDGRARVTETVGRLV